MLLPLHRLPMFSFACISFLMLGVILAVACWLAFRSGKAGTTKLGGPAGRLVAFALLVVAGLGAIFCITIAVIDAPNEILRNGPVRRIEAHWPDGPTESGSGGSGAAARPDGKSPRGLHLRIEMTGGDEAAISRWLRDKTDGDVTFTVDTVDGPEGRITRIDAVIPISEHDLRDLQRDLERDLPNLNLPSGVKIELRGKDD